MARRPLPAPPASLRGRWRRLSRRRRRLIAIVLPLTVALLLGGLAGVSVGALIQMPRVESLADFQPALITQLFDAAASASPPSPASGASC